MKFSRTILGVAVVLTVCLLWTVQVGAYSLFTSDPPESANCSQCHSDWPGSTHSVHTALFDCNACHAASDPVAVVTCLTCHNAGDLMSTHSPVPGPGDMAYCGYCHAGVNSESRRLGEVKALFQ